MKRCSEVFAFFSNAQVQGWKAVVFRQLRHLVTAETNKRRVALFLPGSKDKPHTNTQVETTQIQKYKSTNTQMEKAHTNTQPVAEKATEESPTFYLAARTNT